MAWNIILIEDRGHALVPLLTQNLSLGISPSSEREIETQAWCEPRASPAIVQTASVLSYPGHWIRRWLVSHSTARTHYTNACKVGHTVQKQILVARGEASVW